MVSVHILYLTEKKKIARELMKKKEDTGIIG
jgi:hypothetical protein